MNGLLPQATALRRVTLHGAQRDGLRARHRLEQALAPVDWTPAGLPPQAVLLVKRLVIAPRGGGGAATPLAQRVSTAMNVCAGKARRPWLHADAATADAVVFNDEAEMVACLVRDWLRGLVAQRWWWCSVLGGAGPAQWLHRQVLARGEMLVPAAVRLIDGASSSAGAAATLEAWFARLDDAQAHEALVSVERAFALASAPMPAPSTERNAAGTNTPAVDAPRPALIDREELAALKRLVATVPELDDCALAAPQRRLFAQVLSVARSPSWARTPQLVRALSRIEYGGAQTEALDDEAQASPHDIEPSIARGAGAHGDAARPTAAAPDAQDLRQHGDRPATRAASRRDSPIEKRSHIHATAPGPTDAAPAAPRTAGFEQPAPPQALAAMPISETSGTPATVTTAPTTTSDVHTDFGGIFYLLNAALALGLYGDFTMPRARGLALSPWDWLALIGKAWFGSAFVRDPVWPLLAGLAGRRTAQAPGRDFEAPTAWTMEPSWLLPWGRVQTLSVHATRSRLCVRHAAGFIVFDVPRDPSLRPLVQARALCAAHASLHGAVLSRAPKGPALPRSGLARWLRWMLAYLDARLALSLGAEAGDDVPSLVCRHGARITISAGDVDVALQLADLPLPIRISGLDRDPGWIPAAGRGLRFRFI